MLVKGKKIKGGIIASHHKRTELCPVIKMPLPEKIVIPMLQHIGTTCHLLIKKGEHVKVGQKIGDTDALISAPIHSSVSGTVTDIRLLLFAGGFEVQSVEIKPDGLQTMHEQIKAPIITSNQDCVSAIRESGLVGLGGAGFPTAFKLTPKKDIPLDVLLINGAECEPFITSDYRLMIEQPEHIIEGTQVVMNITGIQKTIIGIESNKPEAIEKISKLIKNTPSIQVMKLETRYPQGGEKQFVYAACSRKVPSGKFPFDIGVLVHNVSTVAFIAHYLKTGIPLISKWVTVDGSSVRNPQNVDVLIGTPLHAVFDFCGGFISEPKKIIMGGPMMGVAQFSLDNTIIKQTNAVLAFDAKDATIPQESVCIRCGRCAKACPMSLLPLYINACINKYKFDDALRYHIYDCIECGSCSYVCPASRYLVQSIRYGKAALRKKSNVKK